MYGTYVWSSYQLQKYIFFTKLVRNCIFILTPLKFFGESLHYKHWAVVISSLAESFFCMGYYPLPQKYSSHASTSC